MRLGGNLAKVVIFLLPIATTVASHQSVNSALDEISILPHERVVEARDLPANDTLPMLTFKFYNGSHIVLRQINPETPAWAVPLALRGKQTFITSDMTEKNYLMDMMGQMWSLAIAAIESMGTPEARIYSSSFLRYFTRDEWEDVRAGFKALIGSACPINGPDELKYMRIYWDTSAAAYAEIPNLPPDQACNLLPGVYGFGFIPEVPGAWPDYAYWLIICPHALSFRTVLQPFDCGLLQARRMYVNLLTGGQMMLHEMMHWKYISEKAVKAGSSRSDAGIRDWNSNPRDPNAVPSNGYGPYNAMLVNTVQGRGSQNPDNYSWFAYESYLLQDKPGQCGGDAMNPPLTNFGTPLP